MEECVNKGKVLFVLHPKHGHSTAHVRGLIYRDALALNGWTATFVSLSSYGQNSILNKLKRTKEEIISISKDYDLIYLLKINSYSFIKELKRTSKAKIVFDLTDALWRPAFRRAWMNLEEILEVSDAVFSENEYVCEYARKYNKHVFNLPACTQIEKFDQHRESGIKRDENRIVIGWIGTDSTVSAIYSIIKPLERLQARYPAIELRIIGEDKEKLRVPLKNIRFSSQHLYTEADMIREALSMDIGLFPAPSDLKDYKIRGPLKALIYMSAGIPAVCLNAGDPAILITDGINGLLINSEEEWEDKIARLIIDPGLREKMGRLGNETVRQKHSLKNAFSSLEKAFLEVLKLDRSKEKITVFTQLNRMVRKISLIPGIALAVFRKLFKAIRAVNGK